MDKNRYEVDVRTVDRATLRDISDVKIDTSLPVEARVKRYIEQVGNPYCYLDHGIVVHIDYAETDVTLQERMVSLARTMEMRQGIFGVSAHDIDKRIPMNDNEHVNEAG